MCLGCAILSLTKLARQAAQNVWPHDGSMRGRWVASSNGCVQILHSRREASIARQDEEEEEEEDEEREARCRLANNMA